MCRLRAKTWTPWDFDSTVHTTGRGEDKTSSLQYLCELFYEMLLCKNYTLTELDNQGVVCADSGPKPGLHGTSTPPSIPQDKERTKQVVCNTCVSCFTKCFCVSSGL